MDGDGSIRKQSSGRWGERVSSSPLTPQQLDDVMCHSVRALHGSYYLELTFTLLYYPPEVSSMKYCCSGVFRKEYFRLVNTYCKQKKITKN